MTKLPTYNSTPTNESSTMGAFWSQLLPPHPTFTEANIPSPEGKVFIVTGGNAGIGLELVKMLHAHGGCTIYITSRNEARISAAIETIKTSAPTPSDSPAVLKSLVIDFSDSTDHITRRNDFPCPRISPRRSLEQRRHRSRPPKGA